MAHIYCDANANRILYADRAGQNYSNFPITLNDSVGNGPSWICLAEDAARKTLNWNDKDPIDYRISDAYFDVKRWGQFPVPLRYNRIDKTCGYFGTEGGGATGTYNFSSCWYAKALIWDVCKDVQDRY